VAFFFPLIHRQTVFQYVRALARNPIESAPSVSFYIIWVSSRKSALAISKGQRRAAPMCPCALVLSLAKLTTLTIHATEKQTFEAFRMEID